MGSYYHVFDYRLYGAVPHEGDETLSDELLTLGIAGLAFVLALAGVVLPVGDGGSFALDNLTDVILVNPQDNDFLRYDGSEWVNEAVSVGGSLTYVTVFGATDLSTTSTTYQDLTGMEVTVPSTGTYLIQFSIVIFTGQSGSTVSNYVAYVQCCFTNNTNVIGASAGQVLSAGVTFYYTSGFCTGSRIMELSANDVLKLRWRVNNIYITAYSACGTDSAEYHRVLTIIKLA